MVFNLTFAEIPYEFMLLREYLNLVETSLPALVQSEKNRIWTEAAQSEDTDGATSDVAHHLEMLLDEGITTRFLTASAFIAVWASYEAAVLQFATYIATRRASAPMPHRNGTFVQRARQYFDNVIRFPLHAPATNWDRLEWLAKVRHALAHANGRMEDVNPRDVPLLRTLAGSVRGLAIANDYLVLTLPFVRDSLDLVEGLVTDLQRRVEAAF